MRESDNSLPLIPLSVLTKNCLKTEQELERAKNALDASKASPKPTSTEVLRHLYENERIERTRLESLKKQIQSVQSVTAFKWDPDTLAKQIAIINVQLYGKVKLDNNLAFSEPRESNLLYLTDFHRYLTASFIHQLIVWSELSRSPEGRDIDPPIQHRDSLVSHFIRTAYLLLHAYRDFSGCFAVMKALSSPEVRRIRKIWTQCPSRSKELYKELVAITSPENDYRYYREVLIQKLNMFSADSRSKEGFMICVPWINTFSTQMRHIEREYTASGHGINGGDQKQRLLSAPGAQKLTEVMLTLRKCQSNTSAEWDESATNSKIKPITVQGLRNSVDPPMDLLKLGNGDLGVYHWLVSRVFLTKQQLIDESMEVEPLMAGEELMCDDEAQSDDGEQDLNSLPAVIPDNLVSQANDISLPTELPPSTPLTQSAEDDDVGDRFQMTSQQPIEHETSTETQEYSNESVEEEMEDQISAIGETNMNDRTQKHADNSMSEIQDPGSVNILTPPSSSDPLGIIFSNQNDTTVLAENRNLIDTTEGKSDTVKQNWVVDADASNDNPISSSAQTLAQKREARKSRLSPSAPAFVPKIWGMQSLPESVQPKSTASPSSSTTFEEDVSAVSKDYSPKQNLPSGEEDLTEDDEEWKGYQPGHSGNNGANQQAYNSGSDEWKDYKSQQTSDDEVWTGYPGPSTPTTEISRRHSSRSSTSEDWKGYQAHKTEDTWKNESRQQASQHDWQGYTLETLDEDELDSSTMMNGEFGSKQRERETNVGYDPLETFKNQIQSSEPLKSKKYHQGGTIGRGASRKLNKQ
ncbi:hypothetical protein INT43_003847 [Umbelopsis isabellina]|uniref:Ras-GEF domain-containing protein n=1 Tax=Mortierella isabellina TaxID=91625 RepID=A0A8H7PUM5_MORIS|nr:hypothetical protein INT43_003847 [Umbelopsis isabellina]